MRRLFDHRGNGGPERKKKVPVSVLSAKLKGKVPCLAGGKKRRGARPD